MDGSYNRRACCDVVNRGLQVWHGRVYVGTLDGFLVALDAHTGKELWRADTLIDRDTRSYTITGPPQVAGNVVVIGNSGAEFGVRGYVTAYELETGAQALALLHRAGRSGARRAGASRDRDARSKTWDRDSDWESGLGGTVWGEMNYDPELDLLYVGTGNGIAVPGLAAQPARRRQPVSRLHPRLDPDDGRLVWHYQTTPGEMLGLHRHAEHDPRRPSDRRPRRARC